MARGETRSLSDGWPSEATTVHPEESTEVEVRDVNFRGIIPILSFLVTWVAAVCGSLFALVWVYVFEEVVRIESISRNLAADHAGLQIGEVLGPAVAAVAAIQAAYTIGALTSLSEYAQIHRILAPHFIAWPPLREIELAAQPGAVDLDGNPLGGGSVLVARALSGGLSVRTGRTAARSPHIGVAPSSPFRPRAARGSEGSRVPAWIGTTSRRGPRGTGFHSCKICRTRATAQTCAGVRPTRTSVGWGLGGRENWSGRGSAAR